jgi:RimJ/RimL family protein N-acetyltransferase
VNELAPFDLNAATGAEQDAWCELLLACHRADQPEYPQPTRPVMLSRMTPDSDERILGWVARDGGRFRGAATLTLFGTENAHLADLTLQVHPDARRRGTGRALAGLAIGAAREDGRTAVAASSRGGSPGDGFAAALGFRPVLEEVHTILHLSEVDGAVMRAWAAGAEAKTGGFELVRWQDAVPAELMDAFLAARTGMDDMPVGDLDLRPQRSTPEIVRQIEESIRRQGVRLYVVAPRNLVTGALAGYTSVRVTPGNPWAMIGTTTVLPAYRGRGFGLWIKAAMIRWLADTEPQLTAYVTENAAGNAPMRRVNDHLGYRLLETLRVWQLDLAPAAAG